MDSPGQSIDAQRLYLLAQSEDKPLPSATLEQTPPVSAPRYAVEVDLVGGAWAINTSYAALVGLYYRGELKRLAWRRSSSSVVLVPLVAFEVSGNWPQFVFAAVLSTTLHVFTVSADSSLVYTYSEIGGGGTSTQSDWDVTDPSSPAYIKHKPTIPAAPVQSNWSEANSSSLAYIQNKPSLAAVATSGSYSDLDNKPSNVGGAFSPIYLDSSGNFQKSPAFGKVNVTTANRVLRIAFARTNNHLHSSIRLMWASNAVAFEAIVAASHYGAGESSPGIANFGLKLVAFDSTSNINIPINIYAYTVSGVDYVAVVWPGSATGRVTERVKWELSSDNPSDISVSVVEASTLPETKAAGTISFVPNGGTAGTAIGSATQPAYVSSAGVPTAGDTYAGGTAVTLNGSSKAGSTASFYAPTSGGSGNYNLKGMDNGAPVWYAPADTMGNIGTQGTSDSQVSIIYNDTIVCNSASDYAIGLKRFTIMKEYRIMITSTGSSSPNQWIYNNTSSDVTVYCNTSSFLLGRNAQFNLTVGSQSYTKGYTVSIIRVTSTNLYVTYNY